MRSHSLFSLLTLVISLTCVSAVQAAEESLLAVYCQKDTTGADILLDGKVVATCDQEGPRVRKIVMISAGAHTLDVVKTYGKEYEQRFTSQINAVAGQPLQVRASLPPKTITEYGRQMAAKREQEARLAAEKELFEHHLALARKGNIKSINSVIAAYRTGTGTEASPEKANEWREQLAAVQKAQQEKQEREQFATTLQKAESTDLDSAQRLDAIEKLISYYRRGYGTRASEQQADAWEEKRKDIAQQMVREGKLAAAQKEMDNVIYFPFVRSAPAVFEQGGADSASYFTLLPLATAMDIVSLPYTFSEHTSAAMKIKDAQSHATRWAKPDSMIAQAFD